MARRRRLDGTAAVITGGASGIGAALGRALARRGATVVLADRQVDLAERVAGELRTEGHLATAAEIDVRDLDLLTKLVERTVRDNGAIDMFFNNAGIGVGGEIDTYTPSDWD